MKFKKLLSVILAVMMVMSVMPVGAANSAGAGSTGGAGAGSTGGVTPAIWPIIPEGATLIFAEDFESGYTTDTNLLEADGEAVIEKDGKKVLTLKQPAGSGSVPAGYSAMVIDGEAAGFGAGNKVLELKNSINVPTKADGKLNTNDTVSNLRYDFIFDDGNKIDTTSATINGEPNPYYGKQLVYEFEAKTSKLRERQFMKVDATATGVTGGTQSTVTTFQKASGTEWAIRNGSWNTSWYITKGLGMSNKTKFKVVFDQTGDVDVVRTYKDGVLGMIDKSASTVTGGGSSFNGKIIKDFVGEHYTGNVEVANMSAPTGMYGFVTPNTSTIGDTSTTASVYIDNVVVYLVDSIQYEGLASETDINPDEGLEVKFDQPFNATTGTFKVTDMSGNAVANAITAVEMSADKKTATVKMDFGVLEPLTSYKLWVDDEFTSEAGALFYTNPLGITDADEWIELGAFETCDKLEVVASPVTGTITGYDLGDAQEVTLTFSSALDEAVDIANAFSVVDEGLEPVSGLGVSLNAERTVATLDLSTLALGEGVHTITSNENAIYNDSNVKAAITYTFDTVDFNAAATPAKIDQYISGSETDNIINVYLTAATTLTNDNIITGFEVTDMAGNPVNGLGVTVDASGKVITLDIIDVDFEIGKYFIKSTENLVDKRGRQLGTAINIPVKSVAELSDATLIIEDDFEVDYTVGENWLTGAGATLEVSAADGGKWEITGANSHQAGFMGVVDGTALTDNAGNPIEQFDSNVLKITPASDSALTFWRRAADASIDVAGQNKMLIYEYDVYGAISGDRKFMAISTNANHGFQRASNSYHVSTGPWPSGDNVNNKKNWFARKSFSFDTSKAHVLQIVDQTKAVDSIRTYVDGQIYSAAFQAVDNTYSNFGKTAYDFYGENYMGAATLNYGDFNGIYSSFAGTGTVYIDNLKVYLVDILEFEGVDWGENSSGAFNPDMGLTLNFSERVRASELEEFLYVKDAGGNKVSGAIKAIKMSADEKSAFIKFNFAKLEKFTEYALELDFLFRSKDGAYIARDGIIDGGNVAITSFTTSDKLEVTVDNAVISGYDKGDVKDVTVTLSSPLKSSITNVADLFVVKDADENTIEGLAAEISEDRLTITLKLEGLQLGDGTHTIETIEGKLVNEAGIAGSVYVTVNTLDFVGVATPQEGTIVNYVEGSPQRLDVFLSIPTTLSTEDVEKAFVVEDSMGNPVEGLIATMGAGNKSFAFDIAGLELGVGEHTIKSTNYVKDSRGRTLDFAYKFKILPFIATYEMDIEGYVPGSAQTAEIALSYPLSDASVAALNNAFVVKNQYGSNVSGLSVSASADKKTIIIDLSTLDIEGGQYTIASKPGVFVNTKNEVLEDVVINLSTTAAVTGEVTDDAGVGPNSGTALPDGYDFESSYLLQEDFDNEGYQRNINWLSSSAFVPAQFSVDFVGQGNKIVDSSLSIVKDPADPTGDNYVLMNVAGQKDGTGANIAGSSNYHRVKRKLDEDGVEDILIDDYTIVKLSTKVYIPGSGVSGIPTSDSGSVGNTKDTTKIIGLTGGGMSAVNHANLRRSGGSPSYNSWINSGQGLTSGSGTAAKTLTVDEWHTIELIFGNYTKGDGSKMKGYEVWVDGTKITALGGAYAGDYSKVDGMISTLAAATGGGGPIIVYYDDWSIAKSVKLSTHINVAKDEVPQEQDIKLQLTGKLTEDSVALIEEKELITVKDDEGNEVEASITIDNTGDNTKINITPAYGLKYQTNYTVEIAENYVNDKGVVTAIKDENGSAFPGFAYTFATAKALNNTIDLESGALVYDADFMHEETEFNYTMELKGPAAKAVIGAVATFDGNNKLLGIQYKTFDIGDTSKAFNVTSELGTKYLRLFIWEKNADGTMGRLMQIPDEVTSR